METKEFIHEITRRRYGNWSGRHLVDYVSGPEPYTTLQKIQAIHPGITNIATFLSKEKKLPLNQADFDALFTDCSLLLDLVKVYVSRQGYIRSLLEESCFILPKEFADLLLKQSEMYVDSNFLVSSKNLKFVKQGSSHYCPLASLAGEKPAEAAQLVKLMQDLRGVLLSLCK